MRAALILTTVLALTAGSAPADERGRTMKNPNALYRPRARVGRDPRVWYSDALHRRLGDPKPGDWRAAHPEPEQSFAQYTRAKVNRPTVQRHTLVLQPLGNLTPDARRRMEPFKTWLGAYFQLPVQVLPWTPMRGVRRRERTRGELEWTQVHAEDVLYKVLLPRVVDGTYGLQAVTLEDLYPADDWNYVFGYASLGHRVGVASIARFYPEFWGREATEEAEWQGLRRSLLTVAHEVGHQFGLPHCQTWACLMNGSNSLAESDTRPLHLCPTCLKKLRWNVGFDVPERYEALRAFLAKRGLDEEEAWYAKRLAECRGPDVEPEAQD